MDKKFLIVLLPFFLVFSIFSVHAVVCQIGQCAFEDECLNIGKVVNDSGTMVYCNLDSSLNEQKQISSSCNNNYECINLKCVEGICQQKYSKLNQTMLDYIIDFFIGHQTIDCTENSDCESGVCDPATFICQPTGGCPGDKPHSCPSGCSSDPNCGGGGGCPGCVSSVRCTKNSDCNEGYFCDSDNYCKKICVPNWNCSAWSNKEDLCGVRTCRDIKNCVIVRSIDKPVLSKTCGEAVNFCGDGICDAGESCEDCPSDCFEGCNPECEEGMTLCEDGQCRESCGTLIDYTMFWVILVFFLLIVIGVVIFLIFYNVKKVPKKKGSSEGSKSTSSSNKPPAGPPIIGPLLSMVNPQNFQRSQPQRLPIR